MLEIKNCNFFFILQVIQSSPNRDQLKAHLKPPPSLLARGDGAFTTNKSGGRTITSVKTQKPSQTIQNKQAQNKTQAVMLRHVFATARQATSAEVYFFEILHCICLCFVSSIFVLR